MQDEVKLSKKDFDLANWQELIENCPEKECSCYYNILLNKAKEAEESNLQKEQEIFLLLGKITSLHLDLDSKEQPFKPYVVLHNSRSPIIDDISEYHFELIKDIVEEIRDSEMRARVADVIWVAKRDHKMIEIAVDAYIESFKRLIHPEHWTLCVERIERASQLAILLGEQNKSFINVIKVIEDTIESLNGEDPLFLTATLMEILQEYRKGDPIKNAQLAEKMAIISQDAGNFNKARIYWDICSRWYKINQQNELCKNKQILSAETYIKEAESAILGDKPSYIAASHFLQSAIEAFRRIGGQREKINELHFTLLEYQNKSLDEMKIISSGSIDITKFVKQAQQTVKGKSIIDALISLATITSSPQVNKLRDQANESTKKFIFKHLVSSVTVNEMGKVVSRHPSIISNNPKEQEAALRAEMYEFANYHRHISVQASISPACQRILLEHNVRVKDFLAIVSDNVFIPEDREYIFAFGLYSGLIGDLLTSTHLLIPQLENSIRQILFYQGVIVSSLDSEGIQDERNLNSLLYIPELASILGEDLVFDLQGLLIERFGSNLRNRMAHGLMGYDSFYSLDAVYLWWITLRICYIYKIISIKNIETKSEELNGELSKS